MSLRIIKNAGLLSFSRFAGDGLNIVLFIILSRRLGPEGIGEYAFGMAIALLLYSLVDFGLDNLAIRECATRDAGARASFLAVPIGLQVTLALFVAAVLCGIILLRHPAGSEVLVAAVLSGYYVPLALGRVLFTPAFSQERMFGQAVTELCCRGCMIILALALIVWFKAPLPVALLPYPLAGAVLLGVAALSARRYNHALRIRLNWHEARAIIGSAWPFAAAALVFTFQVRTSYLVLGAIGGKAMTGIYASAIKFLETGVLPLLYLSQSAYPSLSATLAGDSRKFQSTADRLFRMSLGGGALLAWTLVAVVPAVIVPLLGKSFASSRSVLQAVAVLALIMGADLPAARILMAADLQRRRVLFILMGVIVNLALALLLVPTIGVFGAVIGTIAGQCVITSLSLRCVWNHGLRSLSWGSILRYIGSLGVAALMGYASWLLSAPEWVGASASLLAMALTWVGTGFISWKTLTGAGGSRSVVTGREISVAAGHENN